LDFLKIDVEGHEAEVLRGGRGTIEQYRPIVLFEYLPEFDQRSQGGGAALFEFFESRGYTVSRADKSGFLHLEMETDLPPDWTNDYVAFDRNGALAGALQDL
jgi:hypothetical protein